MLRKRRTLLTAFLLLTTVLVGLPCWRVYRQLRQEWIDSALIPAVKERNVLEVRSLLRQGANVNIRQTREVPHSPRERLRMLFDRLRGRRAALKPIASPLMLAVSENETVITLALLNRGARGVDDKSEWSPLHFVTSTDSLLVIAAGQGNVEIVRALLDHGAQIDAQDCAGYTALIHHAQDIGEVGAIEFLLAHGAAIEHKNYDGYTALREAALHQNGEAIRSLIRHGADVHVRDSAGKTILQSIRLAPNGFGGHQIDAEALSLLKACGIKE